ncbi:glycosyltransferase family 2 protein [Caldimonas sp. KR1-144]|uniref:glycosyltransferase family 2 protein n=1 Tax=Caldimonas sp. KR1-144 TaxID=3400911 RepID=UPI003C0EDD3C
MNAHGQPRLISIIAPCFNEIAHLDAFCDAIAEQELPDGWSFEALIADGRSTDGTRNRLLARCAEDTRFRLIDNPKRIVSTGLNRCLEQARGALIARMDLHTSYESDYLAQCIAALERTGADNVGGPWRAEGEGVVQEAIAAAFQSRWVMGGARSRDLEYEGPVDTVYLGCWPRRTFEQHGGFDEQLVRNQDDEHNLRLARAGARVWQSREIVSSYWPRATLGQLFRQQLQYGYWKPFVTRKHGRPASLRQLVPGAFVALMALLLVLGLVSPAAARGFAWLGWLYAFYALGASVSIARKAGWELLPMLPLVIVTTHGGYGLGTLRGWFDVITKRRPSAGFGVVTR